MRLVITGSAGMIGRAAVDAALRAGHQVAAIDRRGPARAAVLARHDIVTDLAGRAVDHELDEAFDGADVVIHCAGYLDVKRTGSAEDHVAGNIDSFLRVVSLCTRSNTPLVWCSSRAVFGAARSGMVPDAFTEDDLPMPASDDLYASDKIYMEALGLNEARRTGTSITAMRFASIYGPGKTEAHGEQNILNSLVQSALAGEARHVEGGAQHNDFVYIGDVADALLLAAQGAPKPYGRIYHIGSGTTAPLADYISAIKASLPEAPISCGLGLDYAGRDGQGYIAFDITRATTELGYRPQHTPETGIRSLIEAYRAGDGHDRDEAEKCDDDCAPL
jgi:UDP-glucose 4-epimerase